MVICLKKNICLSCHRMLLVEKNISSHWMTYANNGSGLAEVYETFWLIREASLTAPSMKNRAHRNIPHCKIKCPKFEV